MNEQNQTIIIGGGIAGISAALSLADNGCQVTIIEKGMSLGGHLLQFCCKATEQCNNCGVCLAKDKIMKAVSHPNIRLLTLAEVVGLKGESPDFMVEVVRRPRYIDEYKCIGCSLCYQSCPKAGKAILPSDFYSMPKVYSIDKKECLYFQEEGQCIICEENCPAGAIFFNQQEERLTLPAGAVIMATGFAAYDARKKGYLGYGRFPEVITALDLEQKLLMADSRIIPSASGISRVAFIQCVGSRDPHIGHDFCSKVCCKYAARMAAKLKSKYQDLEVSIFFIDLQKTERDFLALVESLKDKVHFIKGLPVEIEKSENSGVTMRYENIDQGTMDRADFDLVVLSVGISPQAENRYLAEFLGIGIDQNGFLAPGHSMESTITSRKGVFLAGTCQGPKNLIESMAHGQEAALRTIALMNGLVGV